MLSRSFEGLRQVTDALQVKTAKRLAAAGMITPRLPLALGAALPSLLGRGPSLGVVLRMNAIEIPHKVAIHDRRGSVTWSRLDRNANRAASALTAAGVKPGDKIALLLRNGREMAEIMLGAQKVGIVSCPLNTWGKPRELRAVLANTQPKILFYDTAHSEQVAACDVDPSISLIHVGAEQEALGGSVAFEDLMRQGNEAAPPAFTRDRGSAKVVIQTSGTTGVPKGAARDASAAGLGTLANLLGSVPYRRDDVILCPAPIFHSFGLATFTFATALGCTMVLPEKFDAERVLQDIDRFDATALSLVPVMIRRVVSLPDEVKDRYDVSSLRILMASGSVLSLDLKRAATELFGDVLYDLYGSTEGGWVAIADPHTIRTRPRSVGRPVDGIDVALFDAEGKRAEPGEVGEIHVKSKVVFEGYTGGEESSEREGYISIGDLGRFDEDGYLYVEGRADDMVIVGGENIYPAEIEDVIEALPEVSEVAVLGVPDDEYGEVLAAFVVGDVSEEDVISACRSELASFKVPRRVYVVPELPRTATGKVLRRELLAQTDT